ncbi:hypothetical protein AG1IA_09441 [Rhizoctonia solani AG-1 IA]|uniref:Uncharacterized protein n=1 Tax=Thanatephorus cucumeris (strain AG1-IA) TaxID=983506 RepID=L8WIG5_THACA|nr:hypothetical protein AG1IA_09441 [Rhizoctonia solani AG-1 IA]
MYCKWDIHTRKRINRETRPETAQYKFCGLHGLRRKTPLTCAPAPFPII